MLKSKAIWTFSPRAKERGGYEGESVVDFLLRTRGMTDAEEREKFLYPSLKDIQNPAQLDQIDRVKERLKQAKENGETVVIYGDYDADGVTSTTIMYKTLQALGIDCQFYIPNRFSEGYGMNEKAIERFASDFVDLIITVDNGIANIDEVRLANDLGIDVIVTDHHEIQEELPEAYAIIHPDLSPDYRFKPLAGAGIAWQIAHYLLGEEAHALLDLAAIGTVADLVPLTGENRILVSEGLKVLQRTENIGLKQLCHVAKLDGKITERDIGFVLGPRINAVGRLENAMLAVELLLTEDPLEAETIAEEIESLNQERQRIVQNIVDEAERQVDESHRFIMLAQEDWHEGVLGIAASRLVNRYHRPVMLLTLNETTQEWKGSARSVPGFNLFENLMDIRSLFTKFGGHSQAAGMSFPKENFSDIHAFLEERMETNFSGVIGKKEIEIDIALSLEEINETLVHEIEQLAPFGVENERPTFYLEGIPSQVRQIGQDQRHLKLQFQQGNQRIEAIGFQLGHVAPYIAKHSTVSLVGELQINEWNGQTTVQILLEDLAVAEWQLFDDRGKRHLSNVLPYVRQYAHHTFLCHNLEEVKELMAYEHVQLITYETALDSIVETELLTVYDLPPDLESLGRIVEKTKPQSVHVAYHVARDAFIQTIPSREQFKQVYLYIASFQEFDLRKHFPNMIKQLRLPKEQLSFILRVFYDLNFIFVEDKVIRLNRQPEKQALHTSATYQRRLIQAEVEKTLYYSSQHELKEWFIQHVGVVNEEEIIHGL